MDILSDYQIQQNIASAPLALFEEVHYGELDSVPMDQQSCKDFNIDPLTGYPMYDISAVIRSSKLDQRQALAMLEEFESTYLPDDLLDEDALKYACPSLAQMPSELAEYTEKITRLRIEDELRAKGIEDEKQLNELLEKRLSELKAAKESGLKIE